MKQKTVALLLCVFLFTGFLFGEEVQLLFEDEHRDIAFACSISFPAIPDYYDSKRIDNDTFTLLICDMADLISATDETTGIYFSALLYYPFYYEGEERSERVKSKALSWVDKEIKQAPEGISREDQSLPGGLKLTLLKGKYEEESLYTANTIWHNDDFCISLTAMGDDTVLNRFIIDSYVTSLELDNDYGM